jgi:hypothetical protein
VLIPAGVGHFTRLEGPTMQLTFISDVWLSATDNPLPWQAVQD